MSKDSFNKTELDSSYEGIGLPLTPDWANTTERSGWLRIHGQKTGTKNGGFCMVAKKVLANHFTAASKVEFNPLNKNQKAGLVAYFGMESWYYLYLSFNEDRKSKHIQIQSFNNSTTTFYLSEPIDVEDSKNVQLKMSLEEDKILFYYSIIKHRWHKVGPSLNTMISAHNNTESGKENESNAKKEIYIGMGVSNLSTAETYADFDHFKHVVH